MVKVDFFVDANKFRQSSCGVQFFTSKSMEFFSVWHKGKSIAPNVLESRISVWNLHVSNATQFQHAVESHKYCFS